MIVVSDTSAIINLAAVGQLHLLSQLYGTVLIPRAVRSEIVAGGPNAPGADADVNASSFASRRTRKVG